MTVKDAAEFMAQGRKKGKAVWIGLAAAVLLLIPSPAWGMDKTGADQTERQEAVYQKVIAHGGGAYNGYETTNSVEALNHSIKSGYQLIELDMEFSSDGKIIMLHDWDRTAMHYYGTTFSRKLSQSQFMNLSVHGRLEVLTFDKLTEILKKNPDIRIVTDTKGDNIKLLTQISQTAPNLADRFIPQIYSYDQWEAVKALGFRDIILTLYAMADPDPEKAAAFAAERELYAVTMPDYMADRDFCRKLAAKGIAVYVHPVSDYETALHYMAQGACGVYSGTLLPEEFEGIEKEYYLTKAGPDGASTVKLCDNRIEDWKELKLHGRKPGDMVIYRIDQSDKKADHVDIAELEPGKHKLTVSIVNGATDKGSLTYFLWKGSDNLRILHKKYEYRLDAVKETRDFRTAMIQAGIQEEAADILEHSLIAKEGEYAFYFNGEREIFRNGEELLPVQKGSAGKLLLPLGATLEKLGASSVTMGRDKDIVIVYKDEKTRIMANTGIARKGFLRAVYLKHPVVLYLNRAIAAGEFYQYITGRNYIEKDGILILLPESVSLRGLPQEQLFKASETLYR